MQTLYCLVFLGGSEQDVGVFSLTLVIYQTISRNLQEPGLQSRLNITIGIDLFENSICLIRKLDLPAIYLDFPGNVS